MFQLHSAPQIFVLMGQLVCRMMSKQRTIVNVVLTGRDLLVLSVSNVAKSDINVLVLSVSNVAKSDINVEYAGTLQIVTNIG